MQEAYLTLGFSFLVALGAAWIVCVGFFWRFGRRCTSLEFRVLDLEERTTKVSGRDLANKRWAKKDSFDAEMAQVLQQGTPPRKRYDNDPLGHD